MKQVCIDAVNAHLTSIYGKAKQATPAMIERIEKRMKEGGKVLARRDPARWRGLSEDERTSAIGKWVAEQEQIAAENKAIGALHKVSRITDSVREVADIASALPDSPGKHGKALITWLRGVDNTILAERQKSSALFGDMLGKLKSTARFDFGSKERDTFFAKVDREIHGENTGDADAKQFAKTWSDAMEEIRQAKNRLGAGIRKLDNYTPQYHDSTLMQRAGVKDKWVSFMMKNLDRSKYMDEAGVALNDNDLRDVVLKMYDSIVTSVLLLLKR